MARLETRSCGHLAEVGTARFRVWETSSSRVLSNRQNHFMGQLSCLWASLTPGCGSGDSSLS